MEELITEGYVPSIDVYSSIDRRDTVFLDSSLRNELGRKSYIGMLPYSIHTPGGPDAVDILNSLGDRTMMGFLSYDYGMGLMDIRSRHPDTDIPLFALADFDVIVEDDPDNRTLRIVCRGRVTDARTEMETVKRILSSASSPEVPPSPHKISEESTSREEFVRAVESAIASEVEGEYYVLNLSRRVRVRSDADPFEVFLRLRAQSPSPYGAYLDLGGIRVVSSSMELLLDVSDGVAWTRPIKGTAPRDKGDEGEGLRALLSSEKDRSELLMVTDMERNDLNRFCEPGTVEVRRFFRPETYSTVYHTVSDVVGKVPGSIGMGDMVRFMFPGGSVTGAPKDACVRAIDTLEDSRRGIYTGSIGLFSKDRTVMNIAIRTIVEHDGVFEYGIGGGITHRSDPQSEYRETVQKGKAMDNALGGQDGTR